MEFEIRDNREAAPGAKKLRAEREEYFQLPSRSTGSRRSSECSWE